MVDLGDARRRRRHALRGGLRRVRAGADGLTSVIPIPGWHHGSATMLLRPILDGTLVRYWHKADMLNALANVRFWAQSGHGTALRSVHFRLPRCSYLLNPAASRTDLRHLSSVLGGLTLHRCWAG